MIQTSIFSRWVVQPPTSQPFSISVLWLFGRKHSGREFTTEIPNPTPEDKTCLESSLTWESTTIYGRFRTWWYPQIINFNRDFHYKSSILGYPYFWKHPYDIWKIFRQNWWNDPVWWSYFTKYHVKLLAVCFLWQNRRVVNQKFGGGLASLVRNSSFFPLEVTARKLF